MGKILFVTGMPRSGTKLLRDLLNNHSEISIPTIETVLIPYLVDKFGKQPNFSDQQVLRAICDEFEKSPFYISYKKREIDLEAFEYFSAKKGVSWQSFFYDILAFYGPKDAQPGMIIGDKTPGYMDHLALIYSLWPQALVVNIVRDPRDCAYSATKAWSKNIYRTAERWNRSMTRMQTVLNDHGFPVHTVYYEKLIDSPEETLKGICDYLDVSFEPGMEIPTRASENLGDATGSMKIVNTNKKKYKTVFSRSQVRKLEQLTFSGMKLHEYEFENNDVAQRTLSKWEKRKYAVQDGINSMRFHIKRRGVSAGLQHFFRIHKQNIR